MICDLYLEVKIFFNWVYYLKGNKYKSLNLKDLCYNFKDIIIITKKIDIKVKHLKKKKQIIIFSLTLDQGTYVII